MNYKDEIKYFQAALKEQRIKSKLTQYKLGQYIGLKSNTGYKEMESNANIKLETLLRLSDRLGIDIEIKKGKIFVFD